MNQKRWILIVITVIAVITCVGIGISMIQKNNEEVSTQDTPPSEKDTTTEKDTVDSSTEGTEAEKESVSQTTETEVETETETESPEPTESESESETETEIETETETESEPETETEVETETEIKPEPTPDPEPHTHAYTLTKTNKATCTKDGSYVYSCSCGDSYSETIKKTGHSYGEYVYNNDATSSKDGTETAICANCGAKTSRTVSGTKLPCTFIDLDPTDWYAQKTVNVYSLPSTDGSKLGSISKGEVVWITGRCDCDETHWFRIDFNGTTAYARTTYIKSSRPAGVFPSLEDDSWKVYYTEDDVVGDGLDAYRVGLLKYAADGTQLYVYTNHTNRYQMNGYYCTYDEYYSEKGKAFQEAFEDWCAENGYPLSRSSFGTYDLGEANDHAYRIKSYYTGFSKNLTTTGEEVVIFNWEDYRIISKCGDIIYEIENPYNLAYLTKTREEVLESYGWTEADLENAKKLALTYNIDFHCYYE